MNDTSKTTKFLAFQCEDTVFAIHRLNKENKAYLEQIMEKKYRASEVGLNRRVLSHWRATGLTDIYGDNPEQTHLSLIGIFWLLVIDELRSFGMSLEKIGAVKDYFFSDPSFPLLESYVIFSFTKKEIDIFLLVSPNGRPVVGTRKEIEIAESLGLLQENYIKINFSILKNRFLVKKDVVVRQKFFNSFLTDTESTILEIIQSGEYKEVVLKFGDGVVTYISKKTLEENPDPIKELKKMIASADGFSEISIKKANGRIVSMEKIIMQKP